MNETLDSLKHKLAQLKELHATDVLPQAQYEEGKATLERQILELVLNAPVQPAAPAAPATAAGSAAPSKATASAAAAAAAAAAPAQNARPSGLLIAGLLVSVLAIAGAGYLLKGSPAAAPEAQAATGADGQPQHSTNTEQIAAMTEKLAARLQEKPDDVDGWSMLARSYSVLGRHAEALKAYEKASNMRKDDATLLADFADSLAVNSNNSLEGEPMKLVERALKLEPNNLKALYLSGTHAFNKADYKSAIKTWETLAKVGPEGNVFVREVEPAIAEARKLAGLPPAAKPLDAAPLGATGGSTAPATSSTSAAAPGGGNVSGTVTLSAALAKQAQPDDTVFVFARASEGSRMPLAILRKQVKDLPITFTLDDSMAMSPASALSSASQVIVGARISKSGNAMPQPGDLSGQSAPVKVGATGLKIEIKETVKP